MFLTGLKFALGFIVGGILLAGVLSLAIGVAELFAYCRKKLRPRLGDTESRVHRHVLSPSRECAVFCFGLRSDDWLSKRAKTETFNRHSQQD
jgi:hypothetical protein